MALRAEFVGEPARCTLDGVHDDLLTAGLGVAGLNGPPPSFADPLRPTPAELRRRAIHAAYRALVDVSPAGGFGRLYGPGAAGVAGVEYLAAVRTPDGRGTSSVLLQIPAGFDPARPQLLAVASSGSRGIYGALPTAAEWGLRHGWAVVHTDKGTGNGLWDLDRGRGYRIDGTLTGERSDPLLAWAPPEEPELAAYARREPHALLLRHAHSGANPEADWGRFLLQAIDAGFALLNREFAGRLRRPLAPESALV
ncbi:MAG: D-(-)-3-hydroxybutyrate oligomer hydrolase, partial [Proteobacteria bacterium]|nr:D-(-)-3-hydroxybutyrate oligomer hydrolase [Pseudomonadota bacterium]